MSCFLSPLQSKQREQLPGMVITANWIHPGAACTRFTRGFSMGGAMALHLVCRRHPDVAGVFALSSFLNKGSVAFQAVEERLQAGLGLPDLLQCHGTSDDLVLHEWGEQTSASLQRAGMATAFHTLPGLHHQLCRAEIELLRSWILARLPATTSS